MANATPHTLAERALVFMVSTVTIVRWPMVDDDDPFFSNVFPFSNILLLLNNVLHARIYIEFGHVELIYNTQNVIEW